MICKDCEMEVDKIGKSTGICHKCAIRKNNCDYRKKPYIPLKDLKGTAEYNRAMSRRNTDSNINLLTVEANTEIKSLETIGNLEGIELTQRKIANEAVDTDIEDAIKRLNLDTTLLNIPLTFVLDSFCNIFDKTIIKTKETMTKEYDTLIADRLHYLLNTDEYEEICKVGLEQKYIQSKRVVVKNELRFYEPFRDLIDSLLNDAVYKEQIRVAIDEYKRIKEELNDPKYVTDTLSMQDKDFTVPSNNNILRSIAERKRQKRFYCAVGCYNLYGSKDKALLEVNNGILAVDEEDARNKFKLFLRNKFDSVVYSEKDFVIKEMGL